MGKIEKMKDAVKGMRDAVNHMEHICAICGCDIVKSRSYKGPTTTISAELCDPCDREVRDEASAKVMRALVVDSLAALDAVF